MDAAASAPTDRSPIRDASRRIPPVPQNGSRRTPAVGTRERFTRALASFGWREMGREKGLRATLRFSRAERSTRWKTRPRTNSSAARSRRSTCGWARSTVPVRPRSEPRAPSTPRISRSIPMPRARTRNRRPARSWSRAHARTSSKDPRTSSSQTTWASPRRARDRGTGPEASARRTLDPTASSRTITPSASNAARTSARGRVGCSPESSTTTRTRAEASGAT
uniref:Uncharacterized protein n=1 Tax=uncultured euryarchaeote Rifle_16ft_4_minimus_37664 TaxID=1665194 RepID=A0A0H4TPK8_9EURY|nr:hypothetical protein [uncultured euryarchaeote Rifle_16ft_4_minimus_37664]